MLGSIRGKKGSGGSWVFCPTKKPEGREIQGDRGASVFLIRKETPSESVLGLMTCLTNYLPKGLQLLPNLFGLNLSSMSRNCPESY